MMLLPQGKAFNALKQRLNNIKILNEHDSEHSQLFEKKYISLFFTFFYFPKRIVNTVDKKKMMQIFFTTQAKLIQEKNKKI